MQTAIALLGVLAALEDDLVLVELPLLDRDINLDNVLPHDATGADVQVAVLRFSFDAVQTSRRTYPTSELPMSPSLRPTARPCAASVRWLWSLPMVSMFVVSAASMASPFMFFSGAIPHPSWTLRRASYVRRDRDECMRGSYAHEADLVLDFYHVVGVGGSGGWWVV